MKRGIRAQIARRAPMRTTHHTSRRRVIGVVAAGAAAVAAASAMALSWRRTRAALIESRRGYAANQ